MNDDNNNYYYCYILGSHNDLKKNLQTYFRVHALLFLVANSSEMLALSSPVYECFNRKTRFLLVIFLYYMSRVFKWCVLAVW